MLRSLCVLIGLGSIVVGPARADIINVTVNGTVSGSLLGQTECDNPSPPDCVQIAPPGPSFQTFQSSFSGTNTQLGAFSASGSAISTGQAFPASVQGFADQNTTATANTLDIELSGGHSTSAVTLFVVSENDNISVSFDVTKESVMGIFSRVSGMATNGGELLDSKGNVILTIPINAYPFNQPPPTILQPGTYQFEASVSGGEFSTSFPPNGSAVDFDLLLDTSFTPVPTPEPREALLAALLATMLSGYVVSRRRRAPR